MDTQLFLKEQGFWEELANHVIITTFTYVKAEVILKCQDLLEESGFSVLLSHLCSPFSSFLLTPERCTLIH